MTNYKEKFDNIISKVKTSNKIAIISHINPDGDTLGSGLALYLFLIKLGKDVVLLCDDDYSKRLTILPQIEAYQKSTKEDKFELAIAVDCSDIDRLGKQINVFNRAKYRLCIDHHKTNNYFADYTLNSPVCATCELIYELLSYWNIDLIDSVIMTNLLCGIITDSGALTFSATTGRTHEILTKTYEYGIDISYFMHALTKSLTVEEFKLRSAVLNKCRFECDGEVGIIFFNSQIFNSTGTNITCTEGIINNVININSVKVAIAITEVYDKSYKVSFRTKALVDASDCAMEFGGGGHAFASGCRISGYYEDVIDKLVKVCRDRL